MNQKLKNKKQLMKGVATFFSAAALFTALPHTFYADLTKADYQKIKNASTFKEFIESSPNLDFKWGNESIFHSIIKLGLNYSGEICKALIEHLKNNSKKTIDDMRDWEGNTPLHIACQEGDSILTQLFIENGASINAQNNYGQTPLDIATESVKKTILPLEFCSQDGFQNYLVSKKLNQMTCSWCQKAFNKTTTPALNELKSVFDCKDDEDAPIYAHPICPNCIKNINAFSKCHCGACLACKCTHR